MGKSRGRVVKEARKGPGRGKFNVASRTRFYTHPARNDPKGAHALPPPLRAPQRPARHAFRVPDTLTQHFGGQASESSGAIRFPGAKPVSGPVCPEMAWHACLGPLPATISCGMLSKSGCGARRCPHRTASRSLWGRSNLEAGCAGSRGTVAVWPTASPFPAVWCIQSHSPSIRTLRRRARCTGLGMPVAAANPPPALQGAAAPAGGRTL